MRHVSTFDNLQQKSMTKIYITALVYISHYPHIFSYFQIFINIENSLPTSVVLYNTNTYGVLSQEWKLCIHDQQRLKILLWQFSSYSYNRQKVENFHFHFFSITFTFTRIFLLLYLTLGHIFSTILKSLWL